MTDYFGERQHDNHDRLNRMEERQIEVLQSVAALDANVTSLCKKFDNFIDIGGVRCATHTEQIKTQRKGLKALYGWVSAITMALIYALINHLIGTP